MTKPDNRLPRSGNVFLKLVLLLVCPLRIVALGDDGVLVTESLANDPERNFRLKQAHSERVPESVGVRVFDSRGVKHFL